MLMQRVIKTIICLSLLSLLSACAYLSPAGPGDLPPILAQDDIIRPYMNLGRIQITREAYGSDYTMTTDIRNWGFTAIRKEAAKMGADAVILPEVSAHSITYAILPSTEYRATGVAIRFK